MPSRDFQWANRVFGGHPLNTITQNVEGSSASRTALESALSVRGLVARVIVLTGTYGKVDFLLNGKPYTQYKSKNFTQANALAFINAAATSDGLPA